MATQGVTAQIGGFSEPGAMLDKMVALVMGSARSGVSVHLCIG